MTPGLFNVAFSHVEGLEYVKVQHPEIFKKWSEFHNLPLCCGTTQSDWLTSCCLIAHDESCLRFLLDEGMAFQGVPGTKLSRPLSGIQRVGWVGQAIARLLTRLPKTPGNLMSALAYGGGSDPLHSCMWTGNIAATRLLIERGADVASTFNPMRMTPLHLCAIFGHDAVAEYLLSVGAPPEAKDCRGHTPLYYARKRGHIEMVERLTAAANGIIPTPSATMRPGGSAATSRAAISKHSAYSMAALPVQSLEMSVEDIQEE